MLPQSLHYWLYIIGPDSWFLKHSKYWVMLLC